MNYEQVNTVTQPDPTPGKEVVGIHVIRDMEKRMELGFKRYKTYLQTHNGRDALQDLYEELIDATMYIKQRILEQQNAQPLSEAFVNVFNALANEVHSTAIDKGWWNEPRNDGEIIALMHSELSEALEALRHGNPPDDKIPEFTGVETELADVIIRIMDMVPARKWRIAEAIVAKMEYNKSRPVKHGGKKF